MSLLQHALNTAPRQPHASLGGVRWCYVLIPPPFSRPGEQRQGEIIFRVCSIPNYLEYP